MVYELIKDFLDWIQERSDRRSDAVDAGLRAMQSAIIATKKYEESTQDGENNRDEEFRLAELWADAAAKIRNANNELAVRMNEKSRYWSDSEKWSREDIISKRIQLMDLEDEVAILIRS